MAPRMTVWRWTMVGAIALVLPATAIVVAAKDETLHKLGVGIFVLGGVVYIVARIGMIREDRYK